MKKRNENYQNIESIISEGVELKGELNSKGSVRIDGYIEGKVNVLGDIILGQTGRIKGEVKAENMILAGKLEGNVSTKGRFEITTSGMLAGDVTCKILTIQEGGILDGTSKMTKAVDKHDSNKQADGKGK